MSMNNDFVNFIPTDLYHGLIIRISLAFLLESPNRTPVWEGKGAHKIAQ